jgi:hypothetical protein
VADQRYCLACGQPCSPVRLAFLDVLQGQQGGGALPGPQGWAPGTIDMSPVGYGPVYPQQGAAGWLRRYSGLLSLLSVLLLCLIAGLLVGHWVTQGKSTTGRQVVKIEGLSALPAAAASSTTSTTPSTSKAAATSSKSTAKEEEEEAKESANETKAEKAPPAKPTKVGASTLQKLTNSTGKKHQEEINALGSKPIETG